MTLTDSPCSAKPADTSFIINGIEIQALRWRVECEQDRIPVLCLHGWLDNAASFTALAPQLLGRQPALDLVAIDMAGHGLSAHRSLDASYNIWEDIEDVLGVADQLGWDTFHMLAHSRGAFVANLLASVMPERVVSQILLDAFLPVAETTPFPQQLRKYIDSRRSFSNRRLMPYSSVDAAVKKRMQTTKLSEQEVRPVVERDLLKTESDYRWRHDVRLHGASAVKLSEHHRVEVLRALKVPTYVIVARDSTTGEYLRKSNDYLDSHRVITVLQHEGGHHFHLENMQVESIAESVHQWFARYEP